MMRPAVHHPGHGRRSRSCSASPSSAGRADSIARRSSRESPSRPWLSAVGSFAAHALGKLAAGGGGPDPGGAAVFIVADPGHQARLHQRRNGARKHRWIESLTCGQRREADLPLAHDRQQHRRAGRGEAGRLAGAGRTKGTREPGDRDPEADGGLFVEDRCGGDQIQRNACLLASIRLAAHPFAVTRIQRE